VIGRGSVRCWRIGRGRLVDLGLVRLWSVSRCELARNVE
jgi:hypothetical protein